MATSADPTQRRRSNDLLREDQVETVGAIDIGSNSIRMVIGEVSADGRTEVLERLNRAARLGQDTFRRGRLSGPLMRAVVNILRDYRRHMEMEELHFFPLAETTLTPEDWGVVDREVEQMVDPMFGGSVEERFKVLRNEILLWDEVTP